MKKMFFVIPVYKVENYLGRCVESVLNQTYPNVEIILVDDGSPDNCPALCDEFAQKHENVFVIHKENGGLSDARNAGIKRVLEIADSEDYITFLDSDDYVHKDYAKITVGLCESNSCDAVQASYEKGEDNTFSDKILDNVRRMCYSVVKR
jgi:glycosyltransferase involved in cell wall biosynthesis